MYDNETDVHSYMVMRVPRPRIWWVGLTFTLMSIVMDDNERISYWDDNSKIQCYNEM